MTPEHIFHQAVVSTQPRQRGSLAGVLRESQMANRLDSDEEPTSESAKQARALIEKPSQRPHARTKINPDSFLPDAAGAIAETKALPYARILGQATAETELEMADWDGDDTLSPALQNLQWLQQRDQQHSARREDGDHGLAGSLMPWLIAIVVSLVTSVAGLTAITGLPEDLKTLGIIPVIAATTTSPELTTPRTRPTVLPKLASKLQGRLQPTTQNAAKVPEVQPRPVFGHSAMSLLQTSEKAELPSAGPPNPLLRASFEVSSRY